MNQRSFSVTIVNLVINGFMADQSVFPSAFVVVFTLLWLPKLLASHMDEWLLHTRHNMLYQRAVSILSLHICGGAASCFEMGNKRHPNLCRLTRYQSSDRGRCCRLQEVANGQPKCKWSCCQCSNSSSNVVLQFSCLSSHTANACWLIQLNLLSILSLESLKSWRKRETRDLWAFPEPSLGQSQPSTGISPHRSQKPALNKDTHTHTHTRTHI